MHNNPPKKSSGRPPRDYDPKIFEGLCSVQCTQNEIEHIFRADIRSINAWCIRHYGEDYHTIYKTYSAGGKASVKRNLFNLSKTNAAAAIWLSKIWLGYKENDVESLLLQLESFRAKIMDTSRNPVAQMREDTKNRPCDIIPLEKSNT